MSEKPPDCVIRWQLLEVAKAEVKANRSGDVDLSNLTKAEIAALDKLTCPWCGYQEIEVAKQEEEGGSIKMLARCEVCGASEIDPAKLKEITGEIKKGWLKGDGPMQMYNHQRDGELKEELFAIKTGHRWVAFTKTGKMVYLPDQHPMVQAWQKR